MEDQPTVRDLQSDPAHTPGDGWVDEGGASHLGPATHLEAAHAHEEPDVDGAGADEAGNAGRDTSGA